MQFKVPQFIEIEDKVFGPLTFKQFLYLVGGAGFSYLSIVILPTIFSLFLVPIFIGLALALAFAKYNEKPFIHTLYAFFKFYTNSRIYVWQKGAPTKSKAIEKNKEVSSKNTMTDEKLKTLSWSLDVIDNKK